MRVSRYIDTLDLSHSGSTTDSSLAVMMSRSISFDGATDGTGGGNVCDVSVDTVDESLRRTVHVHELDPDPPSPFSESFASKNVAPQVKLLNVGEGKSERLSKSLKFRWGGDSSRKVQMMSKRRTNEPRWRNEHMGAPGRRNEG